MRHGTASAHWPVSVIWVPRETLATMREREAGRHVRKLAPHMRRGLETWQALKVLKELSAMSSSRLIHLSGWAALVGFALIPILQVARVIAFPDTLTLSAISAMDIFFV